MLKHNGFVLLILSTQLCLSQPPTRLPEVTVSETQTEGLAEEQPVGPNEQPEWTLHRRFARTRVYVLPPWQVEAEQWWRARAFREG